KAQRSIKKFANNAIKTLKKISVGLTVGAGAAITAITVMVNKYAAEIDKLAKTSSKLGITVKSLQKLQYQAELSGLGAVKFNKAFNKMTTVIADASNGLSTAKRAFEKLGLNVEYIKSLSADEQFYAIAEAMKNVSNQTEKLGIAKDIFGAGATGILNTLNSDLRATGKEFDSLGISITQAGAKMVETFNDRKAALSHIFSGFGLQLTAQLAEPFTKLIEFITKTVKEMGGMEVAAKNFAKFIISGIKSSVSAVQTLIKAFVKLENLMLHIENLKLAPAVLAEGIASQVSGTPGLVGDNTQKAFDNTNKIAKNNADLKDNSAIKKLDGLLASLNDSVGGSGSGGGGGVLVQPSTIPGNAANDGVLINKKHAAALTTATEKTKQFAEAATQAAQALAPTKAAASKATSNVFNGDFGKSKSKGLNPGLSGSSQPGLGKSGTVGSIQDYINQSKAGKKMQEMRQGGAFSGQAKGAAYMEAQKSQKVSIELTTDTGKVAGEIFAQPSFVSSLKSFNSRQTNQAARQVAN
ncbi:MAG: hypothetical protein GY707_07565, partial [Desulfobacteraceae bacterium]|nr:hypothetical protein [Desulfobacteraceae bacterium]